MARPGVAEGKIAGKRTGIKRLSAAIGRRTFEGITVRGHCLGIQARTWRVPPKAAGYGYAYDAALAVIRAGKMRHGKPSEGALLWYSTGANHYPGHVVTVVGRLRHGCLSNVGDTIERVPLSYFDNFTVLGWCMPGDVPGWS